VAGGGGVCVLGAGAWGTALAIQAARAGGAAARVSLWARDAARAAAAEAARENARHLPGAALPPSVGVTADMAAALAGAELAVLAVPAQHLRPALAALPAGAPPLLVVAKGVEAGSLRLPLEVVAEARPGLAAAVLTSTQLQLPRRRPGRHQALGPDADQPDPGAVQAEGVEERAGGVVELLPDVGGDVEGAAADDRGEVGEADLDRDRAGQPAARAQPARRPLGQPQQLPVDDGRVVDVGAEGLLVPGRPLRLVGDDAAPFDR